MMPFTLIFVVALSVNIVITFLSSPYPFHYTKVFRSKLSPAASSNSPIDGTMDERNKWITLIRKYLFVYLLATAADWLQGPYVYALYAEYKYAQKEIAILFVAGFGSSMLFGSSVGGMADAGGRRTFVVWYAVIYGLSCITKHFPNFYILLLGRLLGGISTSLLYSVFDAWLIRAHTEAGLGQQRLSESFSWVAYGNSITAIVAGLLANKVANVNTVTQMNATAIAALGTVNYQLPRWCMGGKLNPFDLALVCLVGSGIGALLLWEENYGGKNVKGNNSSGSKCSDSLRHAYYTIIRNEDILLCGAVSSLFEGSMYIFVFLWTPLLQASMKADAATDTLPFGLIFSTFMVSCMAGSSLFRRQSKLYCLESIAVWNLGIASFAMAVTSLSHGYALVQFLAMLVFEATVGMHFPLLGTLKGSIVPEGQRVAIYNLFRIPLNCIVLFSLLTNLSPTASFALNAGLLGTAMLLMRRLQTLRRLQHDDDTTHSESSVSSLEDSWKLQTTKQYADV